MKIWLDDIRPAPEGWVWCKTAEVVIERLMTTPSLIKAISLDNDLGTQLEGWHLAKIIAALARAGMLGEIKLYVHTQNTVAKVKIVDYFHIAEEAWRETGL